MGSIQTVVQDVYNLVNGVVSPDDTSRDAIVTRFKDECGTILERFINELQVEREPNRLRPSNLGVPDRKLWFQINDGSAGSAKHHDQVNGEGLPKSTYDVPYRPLTFLIGSCIESLVLALIRLTGKHTVEGEQTKVSLGGIEGSLDAIIDGVVVDVKSASPYSFSEMKSGSVSSNDPAKDPFGYRDQLSFYRAALSSNPNGDVSRTEKRDTPLEIAAWISFDKSSGELLLTQLDPMSGLKSRKTVEKLIETKREMLSQPEPPKELCYPTVPEGKSGNESINKLCILCAHKFKCFPDVRLFRYSNGIKYLSKVVKKPEVDEILRVK